MKNNMLKRLFLVTSFLLAGFVMASAQTAVKENTCNNAVQKLTECATTAPATVYLNVDCLQTGGATTQKCEVSAYSETNGCCSTISNTCTDDCCGDDCCDSDCCDEEDCCDASSCDREECN